MELSFSENRAPRRINRSGQAHRCDTPHRAWCGRHRKPSIINSGGIRPPTVMSSPALLIRPSIAADLAAIREIYAHAVAAWHQHLRARRCPTEPRWRAAGTTCWPRGCPGWWPRVAARCWDMPTPVLSGHARPIASVSRTRSICGPTHRGVASVGCCWPNWWRAAQAAGARQMLAVIGDSANLGSIGVHRVLGFERCGLLESVGWKFGRWLDVVLMQRPLGHGAHSAPSGGAA